MENYIAFDTIKSLALKAGFQDCGAIEIKKFDISFFKNWIDRGYNADMQYLERYIDIRENPSLLLENSKSLISFIVSYNIELPDNKDDNMLKFASYSLFNDYHKAIKQALYELIHCIQDIYPNFKAIAFVDSAPILEKVIAKEAGLGWIGKNSLLINKTFGSKILIGEIITNFSTDYNKDIEIDLCKECNICINSCPNSAILNNKTIDSRLCNSYHTIENKHNIPPNINLNYYIFGCDICLKACPWNKKEIEISKILTLNPNMQIFEQNINKKITDKTDFNKANKNSSLSRIKFSKLIDNINHNGKEVLL
jgi:epoxyqueuosine reductase